MHKYYLDNKSLLNGNFSVHKENCPFLPGANQRIYLGKYDSCEDAVRTAKIICIRSNGCYFCNKSSSRVELQKWQNWRIPYNLTVVFYDN